MSSVCGNFFSSSLEYRHVGAGSCGKKAQTSIAPYRGYLEAATSRTTSELRRSRTHSPRPRHHSHMKGASRLKSWAVWAS
eukprot:3638001-Rhodomonas_salina.1